MRSAKLREAVNIYWRMSDNHFVVQRQAPWGHLAYRDCGPPIAILGEEFEQKIVAAVDSALDSFGNSSDPGSTYSDSQYSEFHTQYLQSSILRDSSGDLEVRPMHREKGGFVGIESECIKVSRADVPSRLASAIRKAFTIAS